MQTRSSQTEGRAWANHEVREDSDIKELQQHGFSEGAEGKNCGCFYNWVVHIIGFKTPFFFFLAPSNSTVGDEPSRPRVGSIISIKMA